MRSSNNLEYKIPSGKCWDGRNSSFVIAKPILEEILLRDINRDLQIVNSEEINLTESTNGHPAAEQCVEDIKTYILHLHANARYEKLLW